MNMRSRTGLGHTKSPSEATSDTPTVSTCTGALVEEHPLASVIWTWYEPGQNAVHSCSVASGMGCPFSNHWYPAAVELVKMLPLLEMVGCAGAGSTVKESVSV